MTFSRRHLLASLGLALPAVALLAAEANAASPDATVDPAAPLSATPNAVPTPSPSPSPTPAHKKTKTKHSTSASSSTTHPTHQVSHKHPKPTTPAPVAAPTQS